MKRVVLAIVFLVAFWDVVVGARLLFSSSPQIAHGASTLWAGAGAPTTPAVASLYHRLGAFSLYAGLMTMAFAAVGARHRPTLTVLLIGYMVTGLGFFWNDLAYFRGTPYFFVKQVFGGLWVLAVIAHFGGRRA